MRAFAKCAKLHYVCHVCVICVSLCVMCVAYLQIDSFSTLIVPLADFERRQSVVFQMCKHFEMAIKKKIHDKWCIDQCSFKVSKLYGGWQSESQDGVMPYHLLENSFQLCISMCMGRLSTPVWQLMLSWSSFSRYVDSRFKRIATQDGPAYLIAARSIEEIRKML